jgi:DNA-binding transcriptional ArsR family regulator
VHPIVAVVDDVTRHVVVCSPPAEGSPRERLVGLAKALGDDVRVQLLLLVRAAPRTTTELSRELEVPRTSLLHHLAILRAAGLLATSVQGARTVYRWRPEALKDLADAAHATLGMGVEISRHLE